MAENQNDEHRDGDVLNATEGRPERRSGADERRGREHRDEPQDWTGRMPPSPRETQSTEKAESPMADAESTDMMDMAPRTKPGQRSGNVEAAEAMTKWFTKIFATTTSTAAARPPSSSVSFVTTAITAKTPSTRRATKTALTASLSLQGAQSCVPVTR